MEMRGITVDRQILSRLSGDFAQTLARLEDEIHEIAGEKFNLGSPKQIGDILFGKMGLPGAKQDRRPAQWATARERARGAGAGRATRCPQASARMAPADEAEVDLHRRAARAHASARPGASTPPTALAATTTGRLSSSEPNLQNIPIRTEAGRKIRARLRRRAGPQAHLGRLQPDRAAPAGPHRRHPAAAGRPSPTASTSTPRPPRRCSACRVDGHDRRTCAAAPRRSISASSTASRPSASPSGSASPHDEAGAYIKQYFERFPGIRDYMDETKRACREHGYVDDAVRPRLPLSGDQVRQPVAARRRRARRRSTRRSRARPPTSSAAP